MEWYIGLYARLGDNLNYRVLEISETGRCLLTVSPKGKVIDRIHDAEPSVDYDTIIIQSHNQFDPIESLKVVKKRGYFEVESVLTLSNITHTFGIYAESTRALLKYPGEIIGIMPSEKRFSSSTLVYITIKLLIGGSAKKRTDEELSTYLKTLYVKYAHPTIPENSNDAYVELDQKGSRLLDYGIAKDIYTYAVINSLYTTTEPTVLWLGQNKSENVRREQSAECTFFDAGDGAPVVNPTRDYTAYVGGELSEDSIQRKLCDNGPYKVVAVDDDFEPRLHKLFPDGERSDQNNERVMEFYRTISGLKHYDEESEFNLMLRIHLDTQKQYDPAVLPGYIDPLLRYTTALELITTRVVGSKATAWIKLTVRPNERQSDESEDLWRRNISLYLRTSIRSDPTKLGQTTQTYSLSDAQSKYISLTAFVNSVANHT